MLTQFVGAFLVLSPTLIAAPVEILPRDFGGGLQPQASVGTKGEIHVVFGQKDGAIFHTSSADQARTFRAPVKVGTLPKLALGMHRGPRLGVAGERVIVTAISHETGDLIAWTSADHGQTWTEPTRINAAQKSAREGLHAMAVSGQRVAVAWLDLRHGGTELWGAISKDGGASWERDAQIYRSPDGSICQCCAPSLAFGPRGELAAMWRNALGGARDIYTAISANGGESFGAAGKLGSGTWKLNACPMDGGSLAFLHAETGKPSTVWRRDKTLYRARLGALEEPIGEGRDAAVTAITGGAVYTWQSKDGLLLNRPGEAPTMLDPQGSGQSMTSAPDESFAVIVWESGKREAPVLKAEIVR